MPTVRWNQLDEAQATLTDAGWQATRIARVSDLSAAGPARVLEAVNALGVRVGEPHPVLPGCRLSSIDPAHESPSVVRCSLSYEPGPQAEGLTPPGAGGPPYTVEIGAALQQVQTERDRDANLMVVTYTNEGGDQYSRALVFPVMTPQVTMTVRRTEAASPGNKAAQYVGKLNAAGWSFEPNSVEGVWMCTGISGSSPDAGKTWNVSYDFQQAPWTETWAVTGIYTDPVTGEMPADVDAAVNKNKAVKDFNIYDIANFNDLGL